MRSLQETLNLKEKEKGEEKEIEKTKERESERKGKGEKGRVEIRELKISETRKECQKRERFMDPVYDET